jgi:hypothetical protein
MSTPPAVIVWGELLWDRFPDGEQLGGAPANVAWHLAQLGTATALATRVGDDADGHAAIVRLPPPGSTPRWCRSTASAPPARSPSPSRPANRATAWCRDGRGAHRHTPAIAERLVTARALVARHAVAGAEACGAGAALDEPSPRLLGCVI